MSQIILLLKSSIPVMVQITVTKLKHLVERFSPNTLFTAQTHTLAISSRDCEAASSLYAVKCLPKHPVTSSHFKLQNTRGSSTMTAGSITSHSYPVVR